MCFSHAEPRPERKSQLRFGSRRDFYEKHFCVSTATTFSRLPPLLSPNYSAVQSTPSPSRSCQPLSALSSRRQVSLRLKFGQLKQGGQAASPSPALRPSSSTAVPEAARSTGQAQPAAVPPPGAVLQAFRTPPDCTPEHQEEGLTTKQVTTNRSGQALLEAKYLRSCLPS